ncbi:MAG: AAA family ATPase [Firmicutes bacterium]|nr:AAA family ATPase [Bacillota bacterium]
MVKIVAIVNQKGGVAKTTTAVNLSAYVAGTGRRTLLLDMDPQGNATSGAGIERKLVKHCLYDVLINNAPAEAVIVDSAYRNLQVLPATLQLAGAEVELVSAVSRETKLKRALRGVKDRYEYIFIDCPPSLGLLTVNALTAAYSMLIPLQCEYYALEGLSQLTRTFELVRDNLNPRLRLEGVLLTMYDGRTNLSQQVAEEARAFFGARVYQAVIPRSVRLSEAPSHGVPGIYYDPKSRGAAEYARLGEEFLAANEEQRSGMR